MAMSMPTYSVKTEIEVPFHDVDPMNKVWHGHYLKYFELARCDLLELFNYGYKEMHASGFAWPIVDMRIKFIRPLLFEQKIVVHAELVEWEYRIKIAYEVRDLKTNEKLSKGYTTQMAIDIESEETCFESPKILMEKLGLNSLNAELKTGEEPSAQIVPTAEKAPTAEKVQKTSQAKKTERQEGKEKGAAE